MYRARIALAAAAIVAALTVVVYLTISSTVNGSTRKSAEALVTRAQLAFPKFEQLRGVELHSMTSGMAREAEFAQAIALTGDAQRQKVFEAIEARNGRLEAKGRKADLITVVGSAGKVICRNSNINVMVDVDLKAKYGAVARALGGVAVKDVWNFDGRLYEVAAAPIYAANGAVAGALVVGYVASGADLAADHDRSGADVVYIFDKNVQVSSWKGQSGESAEEKALAAAINEPQGPAGVKVTEAIAKGQMTPLFPVKINGEEYMAAAGPLPGNVTPSAQMPAGFVVLSSVSAARAPFASLPMWVLLLGIVALFAAVGAAVLTAMRFLMPLDSIERGVAEVINGNQDYTFEAPSPDTEGLANGLNTMIARLTGRPDPSEAGGSSRDDFSGPIALSDPTGPVAVASPSPENQALAAEPEEAYLQRLFAEYQASRQRNGEEGSPSFDSFVSKLRQNEAQLKQRLNARIVRFKVVAKDGVTTLKPVPLN